MSLSVIPIEIKRIIADFIQPTENTIPEVQSCGRSIVNLSQTCTEFKSTCTEQLNTLKKICKDIKIEEFVNKYPSYQDEYEQPKQGWLTPLGEEVNKMVDSLPGGRPQLLDAVFTGFHNRATFREYTPEIEKDIKQIVELMPESLNCNVGDLRYTLFVTPLAAACINPNIPLHIIEFLLQKGADPNALICLNLKRVHMLTGLKKNMDKERYIAIEQIFKEHAENVEHKNNS